MAITQKTEVTLRVTGAGKSHSRLDATLRDLTFAIDEPVARGGTNMGPSPTETALAALVGCTNVIGHKCADALGVDIGDLSIRVASQFDRRGVTLEKEIDVPFVSIDQEVTASGSAGQADLDRVAIEVAKYCPLSKLFEQAGTTLTTTWKRAG